MRKLCNSQTSGPISKTDCNTAFIFIEFVAVFTLQWQNRIAVPETAGPAKPKIFTIWPFTKTNKKGSRPLPCKNVTLYRTEYLEHAASVGMNSVSKEAQQKIRLIFI